MNRIGQIKSEESREKPKKGVKRTIRGRCDEKSKQSSQERKSLRVSVVMRVVVESRKRNGLKDP